MTGTGTGAAAEEIAGMIGGLAAATAGTPADLRRLSELLGARFGVGSRELCAGADEALVHAVADPSVRGWTARDLVEIARRRAGATAVPLAGDVLAAHAARGPRGGGAEVAALGASVWWDRGRPLVAQWPQGRGLSAAEALRAAVGLVHAWRTLPSLPRAADPGGDLDDVPAGIDPRMLARVRGLLAKAESTTFAEEAEALTAKAQELMGRYALEQAVVDHEARRGAASGAQAGARRIWLDAPYASAKAHLVHRVSTPNRCRAVSLDALDMVTVVGHPTDLATVELLVTSLLVQADRALLAERDPSVGTGRSRTRSFRHAFLLSYATRIGERLAEAAHEAGVRTRAEVGENLLPVLAARAEVVEARVAELFPRITTRRPSVGNAAGWHAGRAAADAASLSPDRDALDR